jgi:hypothetical protein
MHLILIFFPAELAIFLKFFEDLELLRFGVFLVYQVSKILTKNFFLLKGEKNRQTIKLSEYIKNILLENTTFFFIHLIDGQEISRKCQ